MQRKMQRPRTENRAEPLRQNGNEEGFLKPNRKDETLTTLPPSPHWGMTFTQYVEPLLWTYRLKK